MRTILLTILLTVSAAAQNSKPAHPFTVIASVGRTARFTDDSLRHDQFNFSLALTVPLYQRLTFTARFSQPFTNRPPTIYTGFGVRIF